MNQKFHFVAPVYARGDRMAEIAEDGNGANPTLTVLPFQFSNSLRLHRPTSVRRMANALRFFRPPRRREIAASWSLVQPNAVGSD